MSIVVTYNGQEFVIPQYGDAGWADNVTNYLSALSTGSLTKSGGAFTLLADANFGATYGLVSEYYKSNSSNIATAGELRLSNTDTIQFRNGANNGNLSLSISGDELYFNGSSITPDLNNYLSTAGGTFTLLADTNFGATYGLISPYFKSTSSNISTTGAVRLANTDTVKWRNGANSADLSLYVSGNNLYFDGTQLNGGGGGGTANQLNSPNTPIASTGIVRLGNTDVIAWRNAADDDDIILNVEGAAVTVNGQQISGPGASGFSSLYQTSSTYSTDDASAEEPISALTFENMGVDASYYKVDAFIRWTAPAGIGFRLGYDAPAGAHVNAQITIPTAETTALIKNLPVNGGSESYGSLVSTTRADDNTTYVATLTATVVIGETTGDFIIWFATETNEQTVTVQGFSTALYTVIG